MIVCPNCGEENPDHARFCVNCGSPLVPAVERAEERRLVTIVFAELVGFRKVTGEFDPEDLKRVLEVGEATSRRLRLSVITSRAVVAEGRARYDEAVTAYGQVTDAWASYGFALEEARTRLGLGRSLRALGRVEEARAELERARSVFEELAAMPFLGEVDMLLGRTAAAPA